MSLKPKSPEDPEVDLAQLSHLELVREVLRRHYISSTMIGQDDTWLPHLCQALMISDEGRKDLIQDFPQLQDAFLKGVPAHDLLDLAHRANMSDEVTRAIAIYFHYLTHQNPHDDQVRLIVGRLLIDRGEVPAAEQIWRRSPSHITGAAPDVSASDVAGQEDSTSSQRSSHKYHSRSEDEDPYDSPERDALAGDASEAGSGHLSPSSSQADAHTHSVSESPALLALEAEVYLAQLRYLDAYRVASRAHHLAPTDIEVLLSFALCAGWVGEEHVEAEALKLALNLDPDHSLARVRYWGCDALQNPPNEVFAEVEAFYAHDRSRVVHHARTAAALRAHRFTQAHEFAQQLTDRYPESQPAQLLLASSLFHLARPREALTICEMLLNRGMNTPSLSSLYLACSISLQSLENREHLRRLHGWSERSPRVGSWYAQFLEMLGHEEEAHLLRTHLAEHHPQAQSALIVYIQALLRYGDLERSESLIQEILQRQPHHLEGWLLMAQVLLERGDLKSSEEALARCVDLPQSQEIKLRILIAQGDYKEASKLALALCQENPSQSALVEYLVNALWQDQEDLETLTVELIHIYQELPEATRPPTLLTLFAYLFFHLRQFELAYQLVDEIYNSGNLVGFRQQRLQFACELAHRFRHIEALDSWSQVAIELHPENHEFLFYHAVSLWYRGEHSKALDQGLNILDVISDETLELDFEQLCEIAIWACELGVYHTAYELLPQIQSHPDYAPGEAIALSLRILINLKDREALKRAVDLAEEWISTTESSERFGFLIDWCLESALSDQRAQHTTRREDQGSIDVIPPSSHPVDDDGLVNDRELLDLGEKWAWRCVERFPDAYDIWRRLSLVLSFQHQLESAIFAQEQVLNAEVNSSADWLSMAHLYESADRKNQAKIAFFQATHLSQDLPFTDRVQYHLERASFLLRQQEVKLAGSVFEELLSWFAPGAQPQPNPEHSNTTHQPHESRENVDSDVETYLLNILSTWLSHVYEHLDHELAYELTHELYERYPSPITSGFLGIGHLYLERFVTALPLLAEGYRSDHYFGLEYAHCLWTLDERADALTVLGECVVTHPQEIDYLRLFILLLIEDGDGETAYQHFHKLAELAPDLEELGELYEQIVGLITIH